MDSIESHDARAEQPRRAEQRIVTGTLHEHIVARFEKRRADLEIGARGALSRGDLFGPHTVLSRDRVEQWFVFFLVASAQVEALTRAHKIVDGAGEDVAAGEIEARHRP